MVKKRKVNEFKNPPVRSWDISSQDDAHLNINKDVRKQYTDLTGSGIGSSSALMRHPLTGSGMAGQIPEVTFVSHSKVNKRKKR